MLRGALWLERVVQSGCVGECVDAWLVYWEEVVEDRITLEGKNLTVPSVFIYPFQTERLVHISFQPYCHRANIDSIAPASCHVEEPT